MKLRILIITTISLIFIQSCKQKADVETDRETLPTTEITIVQLTDAQFRNAGLSSVLPEKEMLGQTITLNGKMEVMPENVITISTPMGGFVRQLKLIPGMSVSKGQTLVRMEDKEYIQLQQDYLSAKNVLSYAKLDFDRQSELSKNQASSDKVLQLAEEKMKQQQILVKSLAEKLRLININPGNLTSDNLNSQIPITAPASGIITEVLVNTGKYVNAGDDMIQILASKGTKLVLKAFEKDIPFLRTGQKITAFTNIQPDKKVKGKIEHIVSRVGQEGFTQIICDIDNASEVIIPGTYLNAEVEGQLTESRTVPDEAVINFEGKEFVFIDLGNLKYEMVEIETGVKEKGKTQIINFSTLKEKNIVVKGAYTLLMKMKNVAE
jgi:cobalt-zinc-cadmium efflux system membrane fusion protein